MSKRERSRLRNRRNELKSTSNGWITAAQLQQLLAQPTLEEAFETYAKIIDPGGLSQSSSNLMMTEIKSEGR